MLLSKTFTFESSHQIPNHPGKCARLHGHSWKLTVYVSGMVNPETGMVLDYYEIKQVVQPLIDRLDHRHLGFGFVGVNSKTQKLNDSRILTGVTVDYESFEMPATVEGIPYAFIPTSENLLHWIAEQLPQDFPWSSLELNETCTSAAILQRTEWFLRAAKLSRKEEKPYARQTVFESGKEGDEEGR